MLPYFGIYVRVCTGMRMSSPDAFSWVRERVSVGAREDRASLYHRGCAWVRVCLFLGPRGHGGFMGSCIPALDHECVGVPWAGGFAWTAVGRLRVSGCRPPVLVHKRMAPWGNFSSGQTF